MPLLNYLLGYHTEYYSRYSQNEEVFSTGPALENGLFASGAGQLLGQCVVDQTHFTSQILFEQPASDSLDVVLFHSN